MTKYIDEDGLSYFMELIKDAYGPTDGASIQTVSKGSISRSGNNIDTMTLGASLTLEPGVYILFGYWVFNTGSSGTRNNQVALGTSSSDFYIRHRVFAATSNWTALTTSCPVELTATTTVYVMGAASQTQVSGNLDSSRIWAIKIPENGSGGNLVVKNGTTSAASVNANSYVDFTVNFGHTFPEPPAFAANFATGTTAGAFGNCTFAVNSVTTTGATIRVFNGDSTLRSPSFRWIAVGKAAEIKKVLVRTIESSEYTVAANSTVLVGVDPAYSGYVPVGVLGINVTTGAPSLTYSNFYLNPAGTQVYVLLQNRSSSSITTKAVVRVLYSIDENAIATVGNRTDITGPIYRTTDGADIGATRDSILWNDLIIASDDADGFNSEGHVHLRDIYQTDGRYGWQIEVSRFDTTAGTKHNGVAAYIDNAGNPTVGFNYPDAWRKALGIDDYVTDHGTSGIWTYRKWASGIAECWGRYSASMAISTATTGYGGYRSGQFTLNLPSGLFSARPVVTATSSSPQGFWVNNTADTTASAIKYYLSASSSCAADTRTVDFHVKGKWK